MSTQATETGPTLIVPGLRGAYEGLGGLAYPLLRIACGALLIPHGWLKLIGGTWTNTAGFMKFLGFPISEVFAVYIGLLELVGGALLVLGLLTRLVAAQVVVFMFVAAFVVHSQVGWWWNSYKVLSPDPLRIFPGGMELPLLWMIVALIILIRGGGDYSVDKGIGKEF